MKDQNYIVIEVTFDDLGVAFAYKELADGDRYVIATSEGRGDNDNYWHEVYLACANGNPCYRVKAPDATLLGTDFDFDRAMGVMPLFRPSFETDLLRPVLPDVELYNTLNGEIKDYKNAIAVVDSLRDGRHVYDEKFFNLDTFVREYLHEIYRFAVDQVPDGDLQGQDRLDRISQIMREKLFMRFTEENGVFPPLVPPQKPAEEVVVVRNLLDDQEYTFSQETDPRWAVAWAWASENNRMSWLNTHRENKTLEQAYAMLCITVGLASYALGDWAALKPKAERTPINPWNNIPVDRNAGLTPEQQAEQDRILSEGTADEAYTFARVVHGADTKALERKVIDWSLDHGAEFGMEPVAYFARDIPGANFGALQQVIIDVVTPLSLHACDAIIFAAANPDKADIKALEKIALDKCYGDTAYRFAKQVKGADIKALERVVIEYGSPMDLYNFAKDIEGADTGALYQAALDRKNDHVIQLFLEHIPDTDLVVMSSKKDAPSTNNPDNAPMGN